MNTATPLLERPLAGTAGEDLHLPPLSASAGRVHTLDCAAGPAELRVLQGRVWLTVEGRPQDHFLSAGQSYRVHAGPARLHLSAEGRCSARVSLADPSSL
ncbi:MAG: DUF2917 domain-containing protein [Burkholderiales bacterium]|nr:DUF2917 domain-containing protein [Burkholderiales bacterium]